MENYIVVDSEFLKGFCIQCENQKHKFETYFPNNSYTSLSMFVIHFLQTIMRTTFCYQKRELSIELSNHSGLKLKSEILVWLDSGFHL